MSKIRIDIPVRCYNHKVAENLCAFFSEASASWCFCQRETNFSATSTVTETLGDTYRHQIIGIQKLIKIMPNNNSLKEDLAKYEEWARNDKKYDVTISFEGEIVAEIDMSHNSILYYTGPLYKNVTYRDMSSLKKLINSDYLDDFYEEKIKKFLICLVMAAVLSAPEMDLGCGNVILWIDDQKYKKERFLESPLHTEAYAEYNHIMQTRLDFTSTFSWIKSYTGLQEDGKKPPVPFTMMTYLFNRDVHESLLYSIVGLENLYSTKDNGISYKLQNRVNYLFPSITKEQIKGIYKQRSDFVHGKIRMSLCKDYSDLMNGDLPFDDAAILACALLIETMRMLVKNNATTISFNEHLSHKFV